MQCYTYAIEGCVQPSTYTIEVCVQPCTNPIKGRVLNTYMHVQQLNDGIHHESFEYMHVQQVNQMIGYITGVLNTCMCSNLIE